uniref:CID domain-containing protein n=1 Tax=Fundulus heteroclitus TaxID=8078 RepID=A0A3Q2PFW5_FUNHE
MSTFSSASLEKRFRGLTNTMDSIQGLSAWCIDNKKYHSLIVRQWIKCLKKCEWLCSLLKSYFEKSNCDC